MQLLLSKKTEGTLIEYLKLLGRYGFFMMIVVISAFFLPFSSSESTVFDGTWWKPSNINCYWQFASQIFDLGNSWGSLFTA